MTIVAFCETSECQRAARSSGEVEIIKKKKKKKKNSHLAHNSLLCGTAYKSSA